MDEEDRVALLLRNRVVAVDVDHVPRLRPLRRVIHSSVAEVVVDVGLDVAVEELVAIVSILASSTKWQNCRFSPSSCVSLRDDEEQLQVVSALRLGRLGILYSGTRRSSPWCASPCSSRGERIERRHLCQRGQKHAIVVHVIVICFSDSL